MAELQIVIFHILFIYIPYFERIYEIAHQYCTKKRDHTLEEH